MKKNYEKAKDGKEKAALVQAGEQVL